MHLLAQPENNEDPVVLGYEQSIFPLRDSQGKRTSERVRKSPAALKHNACVEPLMWAHYTSGLDTRVTFQRRGGFSHLLACSFPSTIPERKDRLLVVYCSTSYCRLL